MYSRPPACCRRRRSGWTRGPEIWPDEVRIAVERLNLDAASYRQLAEAHGGDGTAIRRGRARHRRGPAARCRTRSPAPAACSSAWSTRSARSRPSASQKGDRVATLVSLTLTPLQITDGLADWDGKSEQVPAQGTRSCSPGRSSRSCPDDLKPELSLAVMDVCGAPALTARVVRQYVDKGTKPVVSVIGGAGKCGLAVAGRGAALPAPRGRSGSCRSRPRRIASTGAGLADVVALADARDPVALAKAVEEAGGPADITVVCVDVPGCEHGAVLSTAAGGTVIFFSMATSFSAAALGAEGLAADVTMLVGNGYVPGHADYAMELLRAEPGVRGLFESRLAED